MLTVFKYPVLMCNESTIDMPEGAKLLSFQSQYGEPVLWALVDPTKPNRARHFRLAGTGHPIDELRTLHYVGTAQFSDGALVFHLFELGDIPKEGI